MQNLMKNDLGAKNAVVLKVVKIKKVKNTAEMKKYFSIPENLKLSNRV